MPGQAYCGPNPRPYSFVPGVGQIPTGPSSSRNRILPSDQEEGEVLNSLSTSRSSYSYSGYVGRDNRPSRASREAPCHSERYRSHARSHEISGTRTWAFWNRRGSHDWHERVTRNGGQNLSRGREREGNYSSQSQSRSRSPARIRDPNANRFSRRGHVLAGPNDPLYPSRVPSLTEIPPYVEFPRAPPKTCQCPVSETCPHRRGNSKDCRPLVPTWQSWMKPKTREVEIVTQVKRRLNENEAKVCRELRKIGQYIEKLKARPLSRNTVHDEITTWLWSVQSLDCTIAQEVLTQSSVLTMLKDFLSEEDEAFRNASRFPIDLEEDLTFLLRKWTAGDLDNDPDRGLLVTRKSNGIESLKLDKKWDHLRECNYFGSGKLVNGQRWPGRIHMRRDGAHGASMAGIYGPSVAEGAQALVMGLHGQNCNYYADRDEGNRVRYIGTARKKKGTSVQAGVLVDNSSHDKEDGPTAHTRMLITSIETGKPVRLFRSDKLPDINPYRPLKGYRYDGLYRVVSCELLEDERKIYGFELQRLLGQGPIRRNDFRTFEETHQQAERRRRRTEASASSRAGLRVHN